MDQTTAPPSLLVLGPGYTAQPIMETARRSKWAVYATYRNTEKRYQLEQAEFTAIAFGSGQLDISEPYHLLITIAPGKEAKEPDPSLAIWESFLKQHPPLSISYLSSTNVYGNHDGGWVDETTPPTPSLERGKRRILAEKSWQRLAEKIESRLFIFRLAGIYGPERNALASLRSGRARSIIKAGQVFSRIHRDDICQAVWSAMTGKHLGGIFNMADDEPCAPHLVIEEAARLLGMQAPAHENWETAPLSEMARSFYMESKRVHNTKVKQELGISLMNPNYKEGLKALLKTEG